jgi:hypothetical protein
MCLPGAECVVDEAVANKLASFDGENLLVSRAYEIIKFQPKLLGS